MTTKTRIEFEGVTLTAKYTEYGHRVTGGVYLPSGCNRGYEVSRHEETGEYFSNIWGVDDHAGLTPEDIAVLDRLFPVTPDRTTPRSYRRASPVLAAAVWAAAGPGEGLDTPKGLALALARRVPAETRKEDFEPFVRATLAYLADRQRAALDRDMAAASFGIAGEQLQYAADFRRLTGRDWDPEADRVTAEEVAALPITPPAPPRPAPDVECLECGATYPPHEAHLVDAGGMGCARCNH